jgi:hypothetical protein
MQPRGVCPDAIEVERDSAVGSREVEELGGREAEEGGQREGQCAEKEGGR